MAWQRDLMHEGARIPCSATESLSGRVTSVAVSTLWEGEAVGDQSEQKNELVYTLQE